MRFLLIFAFCFMLFCGCEKRQSQRNRPLADNDILVEVNGSPITVAQFVNSYKTNCKLVEYLNREGKQSNGYDECMRLFREKHLYELLPQMINGRLVELCAASNGVVVSEKTIADVTKKTLAMFGSAKSVNETANEIGLSSSDLEARIRKDALHHDLLYKVHPEIYSFGRKELDLVRQRFIDHNVRAVASNELQRAICKTIMEKARNGEDFAKLGEIYGQHNPEESKEWGWFEPMDFDNDNETMRYEVFHKDVGSILGPYETVDGFSVVKILEREEGATSYSMAAKRLARVKLVRITRYFFESVEVLDDIRLRQAIESQEEQKADRIFIEKLHENMKLHYPHGTNFYEKLSAVLSI